MRTMQMTSSSITAISDNSSANRSRADSGSTFSSSETSNRSKTSSKRRSHRPRGCRGGSSRKKRREGKVPQEIVGSTVDLAKNNEDDTNPKIEHALLPRTDSAAITNAVKSTTLVDDKTPVRRNTRPITYENADRLPPHSVHAPSFVPLTANAAICFGNQEGFSKVNPSKSEIQPQEPDNAEKENPYCRVSLCYPEHHADYESRSYNISSQILPPLHSKPKTKPRAQQPSTFNFGNNIYALQKSIHHQNSYAEFDNEGYNCYSQQYNTHTHDSEAFKGNIVDSACDPYCYNNYSTSPNISIISNSNQAEAPMPNQQNHEFPHNSGFSATAAPYEPTGFHTENKGQLREEPYPRNPVRPDAYRTARIEKQRLMMEGGSLFVTSPKSFLLGRRDPEE